MRTILIIALILFVAAVFLNEVGHYARARYDLNNATNDIADRLSRYARGKSRVQAANQAAAIARQEGVEVYQYDQDPTRVQVWARVKVAGTLIVGPYRAWRAGKPLDTPYVITDYATSVYQ